MEKKHITRAFVPGDADSQLHPRTIHSYLTSIARISFRYGISPDKFFLSVKVLSRIFRCIFCKNLAEVINKGYIILPRFEGLNGMEIYQEIISVHF
jgi:hypothetical protein